MNINLYPFKGIIDYEIADKKLYYITGPWIVPGVKLYIHIHPSQYKMIEKEYTFLSTVNYNVYKIEDKLYARVFCKKSHLENFYDNYI